MGAKSGHYEANRLLSLIHKMFALAPKLDFDGSNPAHGISKFTEESRERFLHPDEMPSFFKALESLRMTSPTAADAIEVALWTGDTPRKRAAHAMGGVGLATLRMDDPGGEVKEREAHHGPPGRAGHADSAITPPNPREVALRCFVAGVTASRWSIRTSRGRPC